MTKHPLARWALIIVCSSLAMGAFTCLVYVLWPASNSTEAKVESLPSPVASPTASAVAVRNPAGNTAASFNDASATDTKPVKQEGLTKTAKVEASNGNALELLPEDKNAAQFSISLTNAAQYKQPDGTYLIPKNDLPEAERDVSLILAAIFGATAEFKATYQKQSEADAADWWQEKNTDDQGWVADGPADGAGVHADKTVTFNDSPGGRTFATGAVETLANGTIKVTPPANQFPINPKLGVLKKRFRTHLKVNGVEKGYYEWGLDIDVNKTPPVTIVNPEWHSN